MTPQREKYLKMCSPKEKAEIKLIKEVLSKGYDWKFNLNLLHSRKYHLMICVHELRRLKGMDNIARIKGAWYEDVAESNLGYCKCGNLLIEVGADKKPWDVYCRKCGRKIFWREQ